MIEITSLTSEPFELVVLSIRYGAHVYSTITLNPHGKKVIDSFMTTDHMNKAVQLGIISIRHVDECGDEVIEFSFKRAKRIVQSWSPFYNATTWSHNDRL